MKRLHLLLLSTLSLFVLGCSQPGSDAALSELKENNAELSIQLDAANKRIVETESKVTSLEAELDAFTQAYGSEQRDQLATNIDAVEVLLNTVRGDVESASATLKDVQALKAEVETLKDLCVEHEVEASDANQVGQVKEALAKLEQSVNKLERSVGSTPNIGSSVRQLESTVRQLESKVRQLELKVRRFP